jgi:N-acetylmuramoyl-L-alanine amidase
MRPIRYLVLHHSGRDGSTVASITRTHMLQFKWKGIGYHAVGMPDGTVERGRDEDKPGAHVAGFNPHTLGYCMSGNMNLHPPSAVQWKAAVARFAAWCTMHGLDPYTAILGHRETPPFVPKLLRTKKSCPGKKVDMTTFRLHVAMAMGIT